MPHGHRQTAETKARIGAALRKRHEQSDDPRSPPDYIDESMSLDDITYVLSKAISAIA